MTIGEIIREERKKHNMTQKQLAEACGIDDATIRKYESGKLNPKAATLEKIAIGLEIKPIMLLAKKIPNNIKATNGDMILNIFETAQVYGSDNEKIKVCIDNNYYQTFDKKWWNSPYEINTEI